MSTQYHWKLSRQLKDYLSKSGLDKCKQKEDEIKSYTTSHSISKVQCTLKTDYHELTKQSKFRRTPNLRYNLKETSSSFLKIFMNLIPKLNVNNKILPATPKWKSNISVDVSKHSIVSRMQHILNSIYTAESNASKLRRIDELLNHMEQYPEARHYAIKGKAITILLKVREKIKDEQVRGSIRETLAILGYVDPLPGKGIRILSIDGGGVRGVLVIEMLKKFEEITGKRIYELFDYICGVSTGSILAAVLGGHKTKTLDEISELYKEIGTKIFTQSTLKGTSNLMWSHAYYDTALWEELLQQQLGDKDLIHTARDPNSPKISAVSTIVNHERILAYVFRNYTLPYGVESQYMGSYRHKLWEAVRASAAAPSYFEEFKHGEYLHQDGGIMVNNPCAIAIHEAKQLWPNTPIQCVVSFGTGRTPYSITGNDDIKEVTSVSSWKEKFFKILDSATDTEAVHTMLNDLLPEHVYFRFNPYLTEMLTMAEIRPDKIAQLEQDSAMYIRRNEEKFQQAAKALLQEKKISQRIVDWVKLQSQVKGLL
ncbi:calcium-independent phospholipase A2-gamma isoform X2 [Cephus cinctus]|uniref:Calcium-independent phospholipase A2-gamma isoform X2 n=1 Tax=Cephus cinctus TaxID=211228 RepID=A0AAJ7C3M0_CEPCN|nr:calcium-independent phospholipase A2-gamma isoform X2 [Cephus cinctus]XP_024943572.1 calcium-independent phospholipase A2-gamma isoform X2 [Cephus cinctus]